MNERVKALSKDLSVDAPRSPHETLGGYVIAARTLDKCRSQLVGAQGAYTFNCPLDNFFFTFAEIKPETFEQAVSEGLDDNQVENWLREHTSRELNAVKLWNIQLRHTRIVDLPPAVQLHLEDYIQENLPANRRPRTWFDVYDIEEGVI